MERPSRITPVTRHVAHFIHERNTLQWHLPSATIHDLVTMACFIDPSIATYEPCYTTCETRSSISAGPDGRRPVPCLGQSAECRCAALRRQGAVQGDAQRDDGLVHRPLNPQFCRRACGGALKITIKNH